METSFTGDKHTCHSLPCQHTWSIVRTFLPSARFSCTNPSSYRRSTSQLWLLIRHHREKLTPCQLYLQPWADLTEFGTRSTNHRSTFKTRRKAPCQWHQIRSPRRCNACARVCSWTCVCMPEQQRGSVKSINKWSKPHRTENLFWMKRLISLPRRRSYKLVTTEQTNKTERFSEQTDESCVKSLRQHQLLSPSRHLCRF